MNVDQPRQNTMNNSKKIIFILCLYIFLIMSSRFTPNDHKVKTAFIKEKLLQDNANISLSQAFSSIDTDQIYQGTWKRQQADTLDRPQMFLTQNQGSFKMYVYRQTTFTPTYFYRVDFQIFNGDYIDKGTLYYDIFLDQDKYIYQKISNQKAYTYYNDNGTSFSARYRVDDILLTAQEGQMNITQFGFLFQTNQQDQTSVALIISTLNMNIQFIVKQPQDRTAKTIIFAALMLFSAFMPFTSLITILKSIFDLHDNPRRYSLITIMLTNMWDTVLCIVCFIFSFKDQQSLMLFIIPAFLLCLLFTNLQPRFLMSIYQNLSDNNANIRQILCRFNLIHYGSLFSIYPIIIFSNFNWIFFISMSCIIFPQIYVNGFINIRPDISSAYYSKYLLSRFALIFYLKCFPYNIFNFKPDYVLSFICFSLIAVQYALLYAQQKYGSKKVLPRFLLDPVYDYKLEQQLNIEQGFDSSQCSICLTPLHLDPPQNPNELQFEPSFKCMKTPCNHKFHSRCLMVWMKIKMQCPQCRFKLPPYD